uniref:PGrP protein n=1 Tax=Dulem virus 33 TaxID=3145751 RepID=A0AAU8B8Q2_9CAUD
MNLLKCILTANDCYKANQRITPKGVMVHSTGANNPTLKRYVQPLKGDADYDALMAQLGTNTNANSWNRSGTNACVHAFIGKLADGSIAAVQTLPWNWRGWHAGSGTTRSSANNSHISFEICEDDLKDANYFAQVYQTAVELTAMLCKEYNLDPLADEVVICHAEGYRLGMASGHADVEHWFPRHGKTMDDFRADVARTIQEDDDMTQENFKTMWQELRKELQSEAASSWSGEALQWAESNGIMLGDDKGNLLPLDLLTREQMAVMLYRFAQWLGKA